MKAWFLVEESRGDENVFELNATTPEEAQREAEREWNFMTRSDRDNITECFFGQFETDEDGDIDFESAENVVYIKRRRR